MYISSSAWYKLLFEPSNTSVRCVPLLVLFLLHKYYIVCSKNSTKSGTKRTDVFDGSNESLYHADEELYTRFPIHSPCQTNSDPRHVLAGSSLRMLPALGDFNVAIVYNLKSLN